MKFEDEPPPVWRLILLMLAYFALLYLLGCSDPVLTPARCPLALRPCGPGNVGDCVRGLQRCDPETGEFGACEGASWGGPEVCDGRDNDCDGATDSRIYEWRVTCGEPRGACGATAPVCRDATEVCVPPIPPEPEPAICDGIDQDCDGQTDEGIIVPCYTGPSGTANVGACHRGVRLCGDPACYFETTPAEEVPCNGTDDDCDGSTDLCCPTGDEVCDGLDNDCDGEVDEGLTWICDSVIYCVGEAPEEIPCDMLDNDCDGETDEGATVTVDAGLCIDTSGSNCGGIAEQAAALGAAVLDIGVEYPCSLFTVCSFPGDDRIAVARTPARGVFAPDAAVALSTITCMGNLDEYSYDIAVDQARLDLTSAPRSVVLIADERGQTVSGLDESRTAAAVRAANSAVLTFSDVPADYDELGRVESLWDCNTSCLRTKTAEFLRGRAGP